MALAPDNNDLHAIIRELRAQLAQNRTDIQRLQRLVNRLQTAPAVITKAV